jgi:hypothetical protein
MHPKGCGHSSRLCNWLMACYREHGRSYLQERRGGRRWSPKHCRRLLQGMHGGLVTGHLGFGRFGAAESIHSDHSETF